MSILKTVATACVLAVATHASSLAQSLIRDTEIEHMLRDYSDPILEAAGLRPADVDLYIVADPTLNAFVTGGQNIFLHTGIILESETPNQLKGVIAHEAGHISGAHLARVGDGISAAQAPKSQFEEALDIYAPPVFLAGYASLVLLGGPSSSADGYDGRHRDFHDMDVILSDVLDATAPPPDAPTAEAAKALAALSGEFWGGSEGETDGGDQSVRVTLKFTRNGRIVGRGRDGEDGSYTISRGKWVREDDGKLWVAWEEVYDEGFRAICIGHIDVGSAKVTARFASSRRVSGGFQLAKKPSVF